MAFIIGIALAIAVGAWARWIGLDRDRAFYPTVMIVIAALYVLFAVISDSLAALIPEGLVSAGFIALACAGFRRNLWYVVAALAGHGLFDFIHPHAIQNAGVPLWWPEFCGAYDVAAAVFLGWRLRHLKFPSDASITPSPVSGNRM
jgi:hypothetical protein